MDSAEQTQSPDQQPSTISTDAIDGDGNSAFLLDCYEKHLAEFNHHLDSEGDNEPSSKQGKRNMEEEERSKSQVLDQVENEDRRQKKASILSDGMDEVEAGLQQFILGRKRSSDRMRSDRVDPSESMRERFLNYMSEPRFSRRSSSSSSRRADSSPNREIVQLASIKETIEAEKTTQSDLESLITAKLTQCRVIFDFSCDPLSDLKYKVCLLFHCNLFI